MQEIFRRYKKSAMQRYEGTRRDLCVPLCSLRHIRADTIKVMNGAAKLPNTHAYEIAFLWIMPPRV